MFEEKRRVDRGQTRKNDTKVVLAAVKNTQELQPEYYSRIFLQRAGKTNNGEINIHAAGSIYPDLTPTELENAIKNATWESYEHPETMQGYKGFKANIAGRLGLINLNTLPDDTKVRIDDSKNTGFASILVEGAREEKAEFTTLIVGPDKNTNKDIIFTFHPGAPVRPSSLKIDARHGKIVTVREARSLGFELAKLRLSLLT